MRFMGRGEISSPVASQGPGFGDLPAKGLTRTGLAFGADIIMLASCAHVMSWDDALFETHWGTEMRQTQLKIRKGAPNRRIDTPVRKVEEAEACLEALAKSDQGGTAPFRQTLSAFLAAYRSALKILRRYDEQRYATWEASLSVDDRGRMEILLEARDLETYQDGPALGITIGGARCHRFHLAGVEQTIPIVDVCIQQMGLLKSALQVVTS